MKSIKILYKVDYKLIKTGKKFTHLELRFKRKEIDKKNKDIAIRDPNTADMFTKLTDKQLARVVHSKKFIGDYNGLVSAQSPANQSSSAWVAHMVEWLKKDPDNFTKRPMQEYLDDEQAPRFEQELERRKKNQRLANAIFAVDGLKTNPNTQHIFNDYANGNLATIANLMLELITLKYKKVCYAI